jgi:nitrogen fixation protein FixH
MTTRNFWPLLIFTLVGGFLILGGWSFYRAARGTSAVTDADYYSHGLRYNQTLLEHNAAAALGWQTAVTLAGRDLQVVLTDYAQRPVTAASGRLILQDGSRGDDLRLALREETGGVYRGDLPPHLHGEFTAQLDFEQSGVRFSRRLLVALP